MKLLHIDSSILGENSVSRQLTAKLVGAARASDNDATVVYRDLAAQPMAHLAGAHLAAAQGATPESSDIQQDVQAGAKDLEIFLDSDVVIIGAPMYNFSIPSQLKAWIDRIVVAGKTFRYTEKGPEGLAGGKRVLIASTRGGVYAEGTPAAPMDYHETYLRSMLEFLGITDIQFIRAEGLAMGEEPRTRALQAASNEISKAFV